MNSILEEEYKPSLQGISFVLEQGSERFHFLITKKALADYLKIEHSTEAVVASFQTHRQRISAFAAKVKDACPSHQNGYKLIDLDTCRKYSL